MYIEPNTVIKLLRNVPLDENQTDTLWFSDLSSQLSYFNGKVAKTFTQQYFQRKGRGYCRVQANIGEVYNVNYMMFQNTSFSNKWFFAFVNDIEYINNNTVEISFTIDPIQTWLHQFEMGETFIERETVSDDTIGLHIEPENVATGEYVANGSYDDLVDFKDKSIVVVYLDPKATPMGRLASGVYSGADLYAFFPSSLGDYDDPEIDALNAFLSNATQVPDSIINIYMCPRAITGNTVDENHKLDYVGEFVDGRVYTAVDSNTTLDGYLPENKKLLTYPFNFACVDNGNGQSLIDRYEFFKDGRPQYTVTANVTYPVEVVCMPTNYKGIPMHNDDKPLELQENRSERISIKGFPVCGWNFDAYKNWVVQNSIPILFKTAGSGINTVLGGFASGGTRSTVTKGILNGRLRTTGKEVTEYQPADNTGLTGTSNMVSIISDYFADDYSASIQADITRGSFETGSNDFSRGRMEFKYSRMSLNKQNAERIDKYFKAFGYRVCTTKEVNLHQRSRFTYIKTVGANVHGNLPSDDAKMIADCFDSGIRFWSDHAGINNYSEPNDPIGGE